MVQQISKYRGTHNCTSSIEKELGSRRDMPPGEAGSVLRFSTCANGSIAEKSMGGPCKDAPSRKIQTSATVSGPDYCVAGALLGVLDVESAFAGRIQRQPPYQKLINGT